MFYHKNEGKHLKKATSKDIQNTGFEKTGPMIILLHDHPHIALTHIATNKDGQRIPRGYKNGDHVNLLIVTFTLPPMTEVIRIPGTDFCWP
jgi:hypothetical protein